jgi:hypothetical protein
MAMLTVLISFSCSGFVLMLLCMCVLSLSLPLTQCELCIDVVLHVCSLSLPPSWCEPFLRSASLVQGAILDG